MFQSCCRDEQIHICYWGSLTAQMASLSSKAFHRGLIQWHDSGRSQKPSEHLQTANRITPVMDTFVDFTVTYQANPKTF